MSAEAPRTTAPAPEASAAAAEAKPAPVFGSGSQFGGATGFAGFTAAAAAATSSSGAAAEGGDEQGDGDDANPEEFTPTQDFAPVVQLAEVETSTGEEDETSLIDLKCKLYRFEAAGNEWKERGLGIVKLLQHKANNKIRLLMRQEKTLKIRANHIVMPTSKLQEHTGSDKAWVWSAVDYADGEHKVELFCIRFGSPEKAQEFKKAFEAAAEANSKLVTPAAAATVGGDGSAEAADSLADELGKAKVDDAAKSEAEAEGATPDAA